MQIHIDHLNKILLWYYYNDNNKINDLNTTMISINHFDIIIFSKMKYFLTRPEFCFWILLKKN